MDYTAWSMEYWEEAERVQKRMDLIRQKVANQREEMLRKQRLAILYAMYLDCVHTAKDLERRAQRQKEALECAPKF